MDSTEASGAVVTQSLSLVAPTHSDPSPSVSPPGTRVAMHDSTADQDNVGGSDLETNSSTVGSPQRR